MQKRKEISMFIEVTNLSVSVKINNGQNLVDWNIRVGTYF